MIVDRFSRHCDLLRNQLRRVVGTGTGCIGDNAQRRLQSMRQISSLRSRQLNHFGVLRQYAVEVFDQGPDLLRELAFQPVCLPTAHRRQGALHSPERQQRDQHLNHCGERQSAAQQTYQRLYQEVYQRMYKQLRPLYQSIREITGYPS